MVSHVLGTEMLSCQTASRPKSPFLQTRLKHYVAGSRIPLEALPLKQKWWLVKGSASLILYSVDGRQVELLKLESDLINTIIFPAQCRWISLLDLRFAEDSSIALEEITSSAPILHDDYNLTVTLNIIEKLVEKIFELTFMPLRDRLLNMLTNQCSTTGEVFLTHEDLANSLGTSREVITRLLQQLARENLVVLGRGKVRIKSDI